MNPRYSSPHFSTTLTFCRPRILQRLLSCLLLLLTLLAKLRPRDPNFGQVQTSFEAGCFCFLGECKDAEYPRPRSSCQEANGRQMQTPLVARKAIGEFKSKIVAAPARLLPHSSRRQLWTISGLLGTLIPSNGGSSGSAAWALIRTPEEKAAARIFREATPSVVSVARRPKPGERRRRESAEDDGVPPAIGSGFLWDANHVVTNNHVIKEVEKEGILVIFLDASGSTSQDELPRRTVLRAQLVGADPATDTAVLRLLPANFNFTNTTAAGNISETTPLPARMDLPKNITLLKPVPRGQSSNLEVGQDVYAIGNPFGLEHSMSRGIVSGISRTLKIGERPIRGCIQTDASVNPGNSGGPLLDSQGLVIGVNTAILTSSGASAGVGLAIPIDTVSKNVEAILKQGYVNRAYLGITFAPDEVAESLQLPGIVVMGVVAGSPAEKSGVKPMRKGSLGDVVTALDGMRVKTAADLFRLLDKHLPGDPVKFQVQRAKRGVDDEVEDLTINVTLGAVKP